MLKRIILAGSVAIASCSSTIPKSETIMAPAKATVLENYKKTRREIPSGVVLLVAAKYLDDKQLSSLLSQNVIFGENYVQDAQKRTVKIPRDQYHFIGTLQRNKVRDAVKLFGTIQSVDSVKLAEKISAAAKEENLTVNLYIQVNLENDPKHGGVSESELPDLILYVRTLPNVTLVGLMLLGYSDDNLPLFQKLKKLAEGYNLKTSMGTSNDYGEAINQGSTMIRLGRILLK